MKRYRSWAIPLVALGGFAVGAALALHGRDRRRHASRRQHKHQMQSWEGEGGNLATPATDPAESDFRPL
jgi:hypothetical protein